MTKLKVVFTKKMFWNDILLYHFYSSVWFWPGYGHVWLRFTFKEGIVGWATRCVVSRQPSGARAGGELPVPQSPLPGVVHIQWLGGLGACRAGFPWTPPSAHPASACSVPRDGCWSSGLADKHLESNSESAAQKNQTVTVFNSPPPLVYRYYLFLHFFRHTKVLLTF